MYAKAPYTVMQRAMHIHPTVGNSTPDLAGQKPSLCPKELPGSHNRPVNTNFPDSGTA